MLETGKNLNGSPKLVNIRLESDHVVVSLGAVLYSTQRKKITFTVGLAKRVFLCVCVFFAVNILQEENRFELSREATMKITEDYFF